VSSSIYEIAKRISAGNASEFDSVYLDKCLLKPVIFKYFQVFEIKQLIVGDLINDVYERLLTVGKRSKLSPLQSVLKVSKHCNAQIERDKVTFSQLKTTVTRLVIRILGERDPRTRIHLKIKTQLDSLIEDELIVELKPNLYIKPDLAVDKSILTSNKEIIGSLKWPRCEGKDQDMIMPSPVQVREIILKVIDKKQCGVSVDDLVTILVQGFGVAITMHNYSENDETSKAVFDEASKKSDADRDFRLGISKEVEIIIQRLVREIESVDGVPLEPKFDGKKGMIGKHFLGFTLWSGRRVKGQERKFGLTEYRKLSKMSEGQSSYYNKEILRLPVFVEAKKKIINAEVMKEVMKGLRKEFSHRKPKFIEDPYS